MYKDNPRDGLDLEMAFPILGLGKLSRNLSIAAGKAIKILYVFEVDAMLLNM